MVSELPGASIIDEPSTCDDLPAGATLKMKAGIRVWHFCCCFKIFSLPILHILDFFVIPLIILQGTFYVLIRQTAQRQSENVFKRTGWVTSSLF